jgi:hypothetical protein
LITGIYWGINLTVRMLGLVVAFAYWVVGATGIPYRTFSTFYFEGIYRIHGKTFRRLGATF